MYKKTIKIEDDLLESVQKIAKKKFPMRNITNTTKAVREVLIEFITNNSELASTLSEE